MKKFTCFVYLSSVLILMPPLQANSSKQNGFEDQIDQTDIYAIPLDSSEEEEEQELEALEKNKKTPQSE